jgi:hypothetical protein
MDRHLGQESSQDDASGRMQRDDPYVDDKGLGAKNAPGTEGGAHKEQKQRADIKFVEGMEPGAAALLSRMPSSRNGHSSADLVQEYMRRVAADPTLSSSAAGLAVLLSGVPLPPRCIY